MKALVKSKAERGLWLQDVPEPQIGINDVLIKVDRTGICGTDLHIYRWDAWAQATIPVPLVVGHEFVGEIVSGEGHVVCGRCRNCLAGGDISALTPSASACSDPARLPSTSPCP